MSVGQAQGGLPLAVGCECQSATNQREGSHERVSALQQRLPAGQPATDQGCAAIGNLECAVIRLPKLRQVTVGRDRCDGDKRRHHQCPPCSEPELELPEIARWHGQADASPSMAQIAAWPSRGAAPVAVACAPLAGARTRSSRSASATSATWARVSAPSGLKSFSACNTTWAEIALPSASATTLNAIHPRWMVLLSSRCTAGPLLAARGEQIGTLLSSPPAPGVGNRLVLVSAGQRLPGKAEKTGELGICLDAEGGLCFSQGRIHGVSKSLVTAGSQP